MIFHCTRIKQKSRDVIIWCNSLTCTNSTTFVGVIIHNKFNWSDHILYIKTKLQNQLEFFIKDVHFFNKYTLRNVYYNFIYPYLIDCSEIWGKTNDIHLQTLIKIQKKSIRAITFSHYLAHTAPLFISQNILNSKKLIIHRIAPLIFRINSYFRAN